jgi:peptidylprolyl isomerase
MRQILRQAAGGAIFICVAAGAAKAADDAIANLGGQPVKTADLQKFVDALNPAQRAQAAHDPRIAEQLVRSAIGRKIILDEADKQGWDKKPEVAAEIARARQEVVLGTYLQSVAAVPPNYPSEQEVRAAFDANRERLPQYHVAQIYVAEPPGSTADAASEIEKKAHDLARKAKVKGADFAAFARANSDDKTTADKGGDLGWLAEGQILPEILGAVKATPVKGVSEPIHAAGGWHIIEVMGVKPADFAQVHDQIAGLLRQNKAVQTQQAYVEKLLADRQVTVNETAATALFAEKK